MRSNIEGIDKEKRILDCESVLCYEDMEEYLRIFTDRYSNMNVTSIGSSVLGRSIPMISFGKGKKDIVYIGGVHGFDMASSSVMLRFINEYCELRRTGRRIYNLNLGSMEETRTIHIIPMLNPDGVEYAARGITEDNPLCHRVLAMNGSEDFSGWGANARGVDIERNFNVDYVELKTREDPKCGGAPRGFAGVHPESEPESSALCGYIRFNEDIKLILDFKCGGESIAYIDNEGIPRSRSVGQSLARICGKPLVKIGEEEQQGSLAGWCGRVLGVPSYNVYCENEPDVPGSGCFKKYAGLRELLFTAPILV